MNWNLVLQVLGALCPAGFISAVVVVSAVLMSGNKSEE